MSAAQDEYDNLFRDRSRSNTHPEDDNDAASFLHDDSDDDDEEDQDRTPEASVADTQATSRSTSQGGTYRIPAQRQQSNTGPKGVITDAQAYRDAARQHGRPSVSASRTSFQQSFEPNGSASTSYDQGGASTGGPYQQQQQPGGGWDKENVNEEDEEADQDDDEFIQQWRRERLRDLANTNKILGGKRRDRDANRSRFGGIVPVDGAGYLEAVDGSGGVTVVVVYIWDDMSEVSQLVEDCLTPLARKYVNTRFVKLHYRDAEMEPAGVPALLAYRAGDKFAGLVPVVDEIPDDADLSSRTLERVMQRHQIL